MPEDNGCQGQVDMSSLPVISRDSNSINRQWGTPRGTQLSCMFADMHLHRNRQEENPRVHRGKHLDQFCALAYAGWTMCQFVEVVAALTDRGYCRIQGR